MSARVRLVVNIVAVGCLLLTVPRSSVAEGKCARAGSAQWVAPDLRAERDRAIVQADEKIREGLVELTGKFPQLGKPDRLKRHLADRNSGAGRVFIFVSREPGSKGGIFGPPATNEKDQYSVLVAIWPIVPGSDETQMGAFPLYPNLGLEGQVHARAGDPQLDKALKQLVADALAPLKKLEEAARAPRAVPTIGEQVTARPAPNLARLVERAKPDYEGPDATESFYDILKLREVGKADAVPVLEQIVVENLESGRIHGFAAAQALCCIGTPKAHQVLSKHLLTGQYRAGLAVDYTFHWEMGEPQRSRFIEQYLLKNVSEDLVVELQQRASPEENAGRLDFVVKLRNASERPFRVLDHKFYLGKMLFFSRPDGRFARSAVIVKFHYHIPEEWVELRAGQTREYSITVDVRSAGGLGSIDRHVSKDSAVVLETPDMRWDIGKPGRYEVVAMFEAMPLTEMQRKQVQFDNAWSGRAVSKPIQVEIPIPVPTPGPTGSARPNPPAWSEPLSGLRVRVTAPDNAEYREGQPLPLAVELQNVTNEPIPFDSLFPHGRIEVTDSEGKWLGSPWFEIAVSPWEGCTAGLAPQAILKWQVRFDRLRFAKPVTPGSTVHFQYSVPTQVEEPGKLPWTSYSPPVAIKLKDVPPTPLGPEDLPERWGAEMDLVYREFAGLGGLEKRVHIDGRGHVTLVDCADKGRIETALPLERLDVLASRLKQVEIWELSKLEPDPGTLDLGKIRFSLSAGGASMVGFYPLPLSRTEPVLAALRREMAALIDAALKVAADEAQGTAAEAQRRDPSGGLRLRLTAPEGTEYRAGKPLPLVLELENAGDEAVPWPQIGWWIGSPIIRNSRGRQLVVWQPVDMGPLADGDAGLAPGAKVRWTEWFDRLRFKEPPQAGSRLQVRFDVRTRAGGPPIDRDRGIWPIVNAVSNPVAITIRDPHPSRLTEADDIPDRWAESLDLVFQDHLGLAGWRMIHIDGKGRARLVRPSFGAEDPLVPWGRYEAQIGQDELNKLARLLREHRVWELAKVPEGRMPAVTDEPYVEFCLASDGKSLAKLFPEHVYREQPAMVAILKEIRRVMASVVAQTARDGKATAPTLSTAARKLADGLPAGWRLTESGRCDAPSEWSGKTDCEYLRFTNDTLKPDADVPAQATLAVWLTPRDYIGRRLRTRDDQPGGAWLYGQSRDHLLLFEVGPVAFLHSASIKATFQQCGFARLDESDVTPAAATEKTEGHSGAQPAGAAFVMPDAAYKRALADYRSTGPGYVLVTVVNSTTGESRLACIEPEFLLSAIHKEKSFTRDEEGWKRTMAFALEQKDRTFHFSDPEAYKQASPRYTPEILAEVRQRVEGMTTDEIIKEMRDQESDLYRFCFREKDPPCLDPMAHVLMERGIACGRSCKPGLLDIYGKMDDQQGALPKTEDLGDRLKIEVHPQDSIPGGLYAIGPYDASPGKSPDARQLYQWRVEKKIGDGHEELIGRLPLHLHGLGLKGGAALEVLEFTRTGNRISGTVKYVWSLPGAKLPANSVYLSASLPKLSPGQYEVEIVFKDHYQTGDGKVYLAAEGTLPQIRPMSCKFQVPDKDAVSALKKLVAAVALNDQGKVTGVSFAHSSSRVTDADLVHLQGLTELRTLYLHGRDITDRGLVHLKGLAELDELALRATAVTDDGLEHLNGLAKLKKLDLRATFVTEEGVKKLTRVLPNVAVDYDAVSWGEAVNGLQLGLAVAEGPTPLPLDRTLKLGLHVRNVSENDICFPRMDALRRKQGGILLEVNVGGKIRPDSFPGTPQPMEITDYVTLKPGDVSSAEYTFRPTRWNLKDGEKASIRFVLDSKNFSRAWDLTPGKEKEVAVENCWTGKARSGVQEIEIAHKTASTKEQPRLPGSTISFEEATKDGFAFIGLCEAVAQAEVIYHEEGVGKASQQFRVIERLSGDAVVDKEVVVTHYTCVERPHLDPPEQPIRKGQRVIWICREKKPEWREGFEGVKALPDTPENRKAVTGAGRGAKQAVAGSGEDAATPLFHGSDGDGAVEEADVPLWAKPVVAALPGWDVVQCDREPGVRVGATQGRRMLLRRTRREFIGALSQTAGSAPTPDGTNEDQFVTHFTHVDLVVFPANEDLPQDAAGKTPWRDVEQEHFVRAVDMGEGMGFRWFARTTLYWQEQIRDKLDLDGGEDRLQLLAGGLFVEDNGHHTANSVAGLLAHAGEEAVPYIETAIRKHEAKTHGYAMHALALIPGERSTRLLQSFYASDDETVSGGAAWALIHRPYRKAAKPEYLDMLRRQVYVYEAAGACVEFRWEEAIPLLQGVCDKPASWGAFRAALEAKRSLEGRPVPGEVSKAEQAIVDAAYSKSPPDKEAIGRAKQVLLESSDTEAVTVAAVALSVSKMKASHDKVEAVQEAGRDLLRQLPRDRTENLLAALIDGIKAHNKDEGYWRDYAELLSWLTSTDGAHKSSRLPGSRLSIAEAVNRWAVFAVPVARMWTKSEVETTSSGSAGHR